MIIAFILLAAILLAYANGANDNFKGVATLYGSGVTTYGRALAWATGTTLLGSLAAVYFATNLLHRFTGKGLVPDSIAEQPAFGSAVALAAAGTVLLATRFGMPVSTTHALLGALLGAGYAAKLPLNWAGLANNFLAPLLLSPIAALAGVAVLYPILRGARVAMQVNKQTCFCVGVQTIDIVPILSYELALEKAERLTASFGTPVTCVDRYGGKLLGFNVAKLFDWAHYLSAGLVSFARGLNDTPKIAALLLALSWMRPPGTLSLCGAMIALGGCISGRRVAQTMSRRITIMHPGQAFTANLVTGLLVACASWWGLPVSTTHVSCGAIFGLGLVTRKARVTLIGKILLAWITTLPAAASLGWIGYFLLRPV